jgi:PAS domain-containing protein
VGKYNCRCTPVSEISDLEDELLKTGKGLDEYSETWDFFIDADRNAQLEKIDSFIENINGLRKTLKQVYVIIDAILDAGEFMFYIKDTNQKYITANQLFLKNSSLNQKIKILGYDDSKFFSIREAKLNREEDDKILLSGKGISREGFIPGSKKKKWGLIVKKPIFNLSGKIAGVKGSFLDITNKKETEKLNEILELNISFMDIGIALSDFKKKKVIYINNGLAKIFAIKPEKIYKEGSAALINIIHPEDKDAIKSTNFFPEDDIPYKKIEYRIYRNKNEVRWIETTRSYKNLHGEKYVLSISKDITEAKKVQSLEKDNSTKTEVLSELEEYIDSNKNIPASDKEHIQNIIKRLH